MTKEEYERLLQSDYWKGYSYSLIKERNFTCQDCGRSFPGERNKLQVHHLHYRDAKPWSYAPEEVLVLCEECHRRRHGLSVPLPPPVPVVDVPKTVGGQVPVFESSSTVSVDLEHEYGAYSKSYDNTHRTMDDTRWQHNAGTGWERKLLYVAGMALALVFAVRFWPEQSPTELDESVPQTEIQAETEGPQHVDEQRPPSGVSAQNSVSKNESSERLTLEQDISVPSAVVVDEASLSVEHLEMAPPAPAPQPKAAPKPQKEKTTLELLEQKHHAEVVEQARRAGVSTEGTTLDILERIHHADVVKQAKRAGVSTEGSTLDILERIHRNQLSR